MKSLQCANVVSIDFQYDCQLVFVIINNNTPGRININQQVVKMKMLQ